MKQYIAVESDCIKIMSYIRAKEVEIEVEQEMEAKFTADATAHEAANEVLLRKKAEVDGLRKVRMAQKKKNEKSAVRNAKKK